MTKSDSPVVVEHATHKEFAKEKGPNVLTGCGCRTKKVLFVHVNVYALGMYMDKVALKGEFAAYKGKKLQDLQKDDTFFERIIHSPLPKQFELCMARDITGQQLCDALGESLTPRLTDKAPLEQLKAMLADVKLADAQYLFSELVSNISAVFASLQNDTRVMFTLTTDGKLEITVADKALGVIDSVPMCKAIAGVYFDKNCIDADLRAHLVKRFPEILSE